MDNATDKKFSFLIKLLYYGVIIFAVYLFFRYAFGWVAPFILGLVAALIVEPITQFIIKKLHIKRAISGVITTIIFWVIIGAIILCFAGMLITEVSNLFRNTPAIAAGAKTFIQSLGDRITIEYDRLPPDMKSLVQTALTNITDSIGSLISTVTGKLFGFVSGFMMSLPSFFIFITNAIISSCFIAGDYPRIKKFVNMQIPPRHYAAVVHIRNFIFNTIFRLIKAYATIMLITFCMLLIGFKIIGINYAIVIALLIVLVDALPVLGCATVMIPWGVIVLIMGNFRTGIGILILTLVILLVRQIVEPRIVGHHLGLYPLISLIAMYIGLMSYGVAGVFLFPLIVMFLQNMQELGHIKIWKTPEDFKDKPHPSQEEEKVLKHEKT